MAKMAEPLTTTIAPKETPPMDKKLEKLFERYSQLRPLGERAQEYLDRLNSWPIPSKYRSGIVLTIEERLDDLHEFMEQLYLVERPVLEKTQRDLILHRLGFMSKSEAIERLGGEDRLSELREIPRKSKHHMYVYDARDVERLLNKTQEKPMTPAPPPTPAPALVEKLAPIKDPEDAKLAPLKNARYINAHALRVLLPMLTMAPSEQPERFLEVLELNQMLVNLLFKKNEDKQDGLTQDMREFGRGVGAQRTLSKIRGISSSVGWTGPASEGHVMGLADAWVYLTLTIAHTLRELPEGQRMTVLKMLEKGLV